MLTVVQTYNQLESDGSWSQVTQWSDGSYTSVTIDPSQYAAYGIPTGSSPTDQWNSDVQAGLPTASSDESGTVQNPSDPAGGSQATLVSTIYYVDWSKTRDSGHGTVIQKDHYSDGHDVFLDLGYASYLPNGTASMNAWDLVGQGNWAQQAPQTSTNSTPADGGNQGAAGNPFANGNPNIPRASDGQSLDQQSAWTQATYTALYGGNAYTRWVQDHNAAIGQQANAAQNQNNPVQPTRQQTNQPVRAATNAGGSLTPWLIGAGVLVGALALSGRSRR